MKKLLVRLSKLETSIIEQSRNDKIVNPWIVHFRPAGSLSPATRAVASAFVEYDKAGATVNANCLVLRQNGFAADAKVTQNADPTIIMIIKEIKDDGSVTMVRPDTSSYIVTLDDFIANYKTAKVVAGKISTWLGIADAPDWIATKQLASLQLGLASIDASSTKDGIEVQLKPRGVWATRAFKKGQLKLAPCTSKIVSLSASKAPPGSILTTQNFALPAICS